MHSSKSGASDCLAPPEDPLLVPCAENISITDLDPLISDDFFTISSRPLSSDPLPSSLMASADQNEPFSSSPDHEYRDIDVDLSQIQSFSIPDHRLYPNQDPSKDAEQTQASNNPAVDLLLTTQEDNRNRKAAQTQKENIHTRQNDTFSSGNRNNEDAISAIPVQPAIQKPQRRPKRGPYMCKLCKGYGHTAKTCTKRKFPFQNSINVEAPNSQYLLSLLAIETVTEKTPKEQIFYHHEAIVTAILQLSLAAFKGKPYPREIAMQAIHICVEAERIIAECVKYYDQSSTKLNTEATGKENVVNYSGPEKQHPEFQPILQDTEHYLVRTLNAVSSAEYSIRKILSNLGKDEVNKCKGQITDSMSKQMTVKNSSSHPVLPETNEVNQNKVDSPAINLKRSLNFMFHSSDKSDILNLGQKTASECRDLQDPYIPSSSIDLQHGSPEQIDQHYRDIDLFLPEEKQ